MTATEVNRDEHANVSVAAGVRLPCRGCTRDCPNYEHCDGKPWRQPLADVES